MKVSSYSVVDSAPIKRFEVDDLSEVVVLAGPNGVGKTTLLNGLLQLFQNPGSFPAVSLRVTATSQEEIDLWGQATLDTRVPEQANRLRAYLQRPKKRGLLNGGVLNFDSARAFEQIQPYNWSWHFADPFDEDVGWNFSFQSMKGRFQDVIHALIRKVRSQKEEIAKKALELRKGGGTSLELTQFADPLARFKDAFSRLLPGKRMLDIEEQRQNIQYEQAGQTLEFSRLSSGEREVVTVVFDFLLRNPKDCVIVFDEPELHLHPELSYRLLRTLQDVGERNQFVFCTHSPEIITAALEQTVVFVSPVNGDRNQALKVEENDDVASILRALGQSVGVISLGKKIVLIEGQKNSLDKEAYGSILGSEYPDLVLVPTGGKETIANFQKAVDTVLGKTIWGVDFFMLCDGDSAAQRPKSANGSERMRYLPRYHLENYFLDEKAWAIVFEGLAFPPEHDLRNPSFIRDQLRTIAEDYVSYAAALKVSHLVRIAIGNIDLMPKGSANASVDDLVSLIRAEAAAESSRIGIELDAQRLENMCRQEHQKILDAVTRDDNSWKSLIPGKPILKRFASVVQQDYSMLKRLYVRCTKVMQPDPFAEVRQIFEDFQRS